MMTEAEAKNKWCPHARVLESFVSMAGYAAAAVNWKTEAGKFTCIASECMAWRWDRAANEQAELNSLTPAVGYCGLAGKP